jgi:hypothetical protein
VRRLVGVLLVVALGVAVLAYPVALLLDKLAGRDVWVLQTARAPAEVELERELFDATGLSPAARREAVVRIYGDTAASAPDRVVFVGAAEVVVPVEDESLVLLPPRASHPLQAQTLYFAAQRAVVAALLAVVGLLLVRRLAYGGGT